MSDVAPRTLVPLGEITTKIGSGATPRGGKESYIESGIALIRSLNVYDFKFEQDGLAFIDEAQARSLANVAVEADDILLNITGASVARCCMVPSRILPARVNQHVAIVRTNREVADPRYVYYAINSPHYKAHLLSLAQGGSTREALTKSTIQEFQIEAPPLAVQNRIADILSAYDDLIENNTRRIKILEETAQRIYREWFVRFRFPGHENVPLVPSDLGPIPQGWEPRPLEELCLRITDGSHWSPKTVETGLPMASSKDLHRWGIDLSTARMISANDFQSLVRSDCKPLAGDVLITKDGANYLKYCFAVQEDIEAVILSSIALLRPDPTKLSPVLLANCLSDPDVKTRLAGYVSGAAIPRIVLKDFKRFSFPVPPVEIQQLFDRLAGPMARLCGRLIAKNANLRTTRDLLLPKLISGEISVEAADDVGAELMEQTA